MPYVKQTVRESLARGELIADAGSLNYLITKALIEMEKPPFLRFVVQHHINEYLTGQVSMRYQHINDVLGAVLGAVMEYERRMGRSLSDDQYNVINDVLDTTYCAFATPYEEEKIVENGDIPAYAERRTI